MNIDKKQRELILAAAIAIALAFVGYIMFLGPALSKRAALQAPPPVATTTTTTSPTITADAQTAAAAQRAIPVKSSFADVKKSLESMAKTYQVTLTLTNSSAGTPKGVPQQLMINGTATGNWSLLLPFLIKLGTMTAFDGSHQIRSSGPLYLIPNLSLNPRSAQSQLYIAQFKLVVPTRS